MRFRPLSSRRPTAPWLLASLVVAGCSLPADRGEDPLARRLARFRPIRIEADLDSLPPSERRCLEHLVEAARAIDRVFLLQAWRGNADLERRLSGPALELFRIHYGPWDRVDGEPFVEGVGPRPPGAGFYPEDMTREEFEAFVRAHPERRDVLIDPYTVVTRAPDRSLEAVPYSVRYRDLLNRAAHALRRAAEDTSNASLERFLRLRADALLDDDYFESDMAWMDIDARVEPTIGPYETYEDRLFGYKAAFEAFLTVADPKASARLARFRALLPRMERHLPIPDEMKDLERGTESPIRVVDLVYAAGDARAGVQTIAFNLPNDERVRRAKGSKKVLLRNVLWAKYEALLRPIAERLLVPEQADLVDRDAFADQTLFHELCHGLGPGILEIDGRRTEVRIELKELYSPLEEAKADVMGVYQQLFLMQLGEFDPGARERLFATWLAGLFRSMRFGVEEAHGRANLLQFAYALDHGAIRRTDEGYAFDAGRLVETIRDLTREICVIQGRGDYEGARRLLERYARPERAPREDLERLRDLPVDIRPIYAFDGRNEA